MDVTELDPSLGWTAGQLISTPSDLSTLNRALLDGRLLKPARQKELLSTVAAHGFEPEDGWSYGLGFAKRELSCGVPARGHGGDITGSEPRNLTTTDGRSAVITVTALPTSIKGLEHRNAAVHDAMQGETLTPSTWGRCRTAQRRRACARPPSIVENHAETARPSTRTREQQNPALAGRVGHLRMDSTSSGGA